MDPPFTRQGKRNAGRQDWHKTPVAALPDYQCLPIVTRKKEIGIVFYDESGVQGKVRIDEQ
jgi:hypothetical protein